MKEILGAPEDDEEEEPAEERVVRVMESRSKKQKNSSFFAFTAAPKAKTLEVFGHRDIPPLLDAPSD